MHIYLYICVCVCVCVCMWIPMTISVFESSLSGVVFSRMTSYTSIRLNWPFTFGIFHPFWYLGRELVLISGESLAKDYSQHPLNFFCFGIWRVYLDIRYDDWSMEESLAGTTWTKNCPLISSCSFLFFFSNSDAHCKILVPSPMGYVSMYPMKVQF